MRKYHYIEVWEKGNDRMPVARFKTTVSSGHQDWANKISKYSGYDVEYASSSEPEKVFNHIKQTA